jgi:RHS repeat-associated protein
MPRNGLCGVVVVLALLLLAPAGAGAATKAAVASLKAPSRVAQGAKLELTLKLRNASRKATKAGKLAVLLSGDRKRDGRDATLTRTLRVPALKGRATKTVKASVTVPSAVRPGSYFLLACGRSCKAAALRVTGAPAPGGGGTPMPAPVPQPQPGPGPQPTAAPTTTPTATATATPTSTATPGPTPDAPDETELPSGFGDSVEFLYSGPNKVQTGVAPGTIKSARVAVLRGAVKARDGQGLGGVTVTVLDHPELGQTTTRADGGYDLAVNGGGPLTITFERTGFISAQREVDAPWQDFAAVEDVTLVGFDPKVTRIDLDANTAQVAAGTPVTDGDGTRQASVVFKAGTKATMVLPNGATKALDELDVRATEFTAGAAGPDAMPGTLPASSAYTYAAELSVDQAVAAGATEVRFDKPVVNYVDNFLGFPVGGIVPTGYYDREAGTWKAAPNGRVIKLLSVVDGKVNVDTDGDGTADNGLGIDDAERRRLAETRHVGDELWRVPMDHFTPWDHNWPYAPAPDAEPPNPPEPRPDIPSNRRQGECNKPGSIIGCQGQTLAEELEIAGTPLKLRYDTRRAGRRTDRSIEIPLTGRKIPASLEQVRLEISVAGRTEKKTFAPQTSLSYEFVWDRKDAYGREVQGRQPVSYRIGFVYGFRRYNTPAEFAAAFGKFSRAGGEVIGEPRTESARWVSWREVRDEFGIAVGSLDAHGTGLGGWEIDNHHTYDARMRTLYRGDGQEVGAEPLLDTPADVGDPRDADVAPDGQVWVADAAADQVIRFDRDGDREVMAGSVGGGEPCENCLKRVKRLGAGEDPLAKGFPLARPMSVALAPDGGFYVADYMVDWGVQQGVIYRVDPAGHIRKIAGCLCSELGDDGPAVDASITPLDLAVGKDGTLYLADYRNGRIRAIDADGSIRTVAGGGTQADGYKDGINGLEARVVEPMAVATGPDGEVYFGDDGQAGRVRRLDADGTVTTVAGGHWFDPDDNGDGGPAIDANLGNPQGLALGGDGALYLTDVDRVRRVAIDGTIATIAGGGPNQARNADRVPAGSVRFNGAMGVGTAPDGSMFVASQSGLSRISRPFPTTKDGLLAIPSKDASEVYLFNASGRHIRTLDGITGLTLWRFAYDDDGRLTSITDADDRVTRIERDGSGEATAIVAPGGQRTGLTVDATGLRVVTDPAGKTTKLTYDDAGRLEELIDRRNGRHAFGYDPAGRLIRDEAPTGKAQTLSRTETDEGWIVTLTSPEGRKHRWEAGIRPNGDAFLETTDPSGAKTISHTGIDGVRHVEYPTGETIALTTGADPRWGAYVQVPAKLVRRSPSGRTQTTTTSRAVQLADIQDPLSLESITDTVTTNGRTSVLSYDAATRIETATSPEGRVAKTRFDAKGHPVTVEPAAGVTPIIYTYDARGRLARTEQGSRFYEIEYDARERPSIYRDNLGRKTELTYDDADRVVAIKRPGGGTERFEYDAEGARTAVIPPGGQRHVLRRDARGALEAYDPLVGADFLRTHDGDGRLTADGVAGDQTTYTYENGRAKGATWADGAIEYGYEGELDRPSTITRTGGVAERYAFSYDGSETTGITASGTTAGAYTFGYDDNGFLTSSKLVSGAQTVTSAIVRDKDGFVTTDGPFTVARGGVGGTASGITGAGLNLALGRDDIGNLSAKTLTVGGNQRFKLDITRGEDGRIATRTETVAGTTRTYAYRYDLDGRLLEVKRDGVVVEEYGYDANGNRTTHGAELSTFDDEDRLTARGGVAYEYDTAGFVTRRGADVLDYSARGELLSATVGPTTVTYRYDALGRRIARTQGGQTTQYLYGDPSNPVRVTATRSPAGVLTTYRYDDDGLLYEFERSGAKFFVATDQVGTPRVVTNAAGTVVDQREYDTFGNLISDSAPTFDLPIGYAGGLEDRVTGLVRFGFRDLDTASGRWTARDPALYDGGQANLYAYVGNDPVSLRDPLGLWCAGGSVYDGVGGGATLCHSDEGWAVCFEVGFGFGFAVGLDNAKLPKDGESIVAEAKANIPGFGVGIGVELDNCGRVETTGSIDAIAVNVNVGDGTLQLENPVMTEGASVKLAAKVCRRFGGK